jgi:hypothetical protein
MISMAILPWVASPVQEGGWLTPNSSRAPVLALSLLTGGEGSMSCFESRMFLTCARSSSLFHSPAASSQISARHGFLSCGMTAM